MAGIVLGEGWPGYGGESLIIIILSFTLIGWRLWRSRTALVSPLMLFIALGYLSIQPWSAPDLPENHVVHLADNRKVIAEGIIREAPLSRPNGQRLLIEAIRLKNLDGQRAVSGNILVTIGRGEMPEFKRGDKIQVRGRLKRVFGFHNPGGFNYERYLAFQKIWCRIWVSPTQVDILERPSTMTLLGRVNAVRQAVGQRIDTTVPGESGQILKALVIGDRSGISPPLREVFNRTGTGHLLAISGLHIGIVATVSFFIFRWLLSYSKMLLRRAWAVKGAAILTFIPVICYGIMSGMSPSTQRAVVMVAVFLLAYLTGKLQNAFNTLAVAGVIILAVHPPSLFSISFQLSFAAVAFIILGVSRPWPQGTAPLVSRTSILKKAATMAGVTILATLGTLPLVMQSFNEVSLIGVGTNLLAVPLVGFVAVPAGLMGMFTHSASIFLSTTCFEIAGIILDVTLTGIHFLAEGDAVSLKTFTPSVLEIAIYYILVAMMIMLAPMFLSYLKGGKIPNTTGLLHPKILYAVLFLTAAAGIADGVYWAYQRFWHADLRVTIIDVGSGSAALVEFPGGPVMLIDGGGFNDNAAFDVGAKVVAPYLWRKKIMAVDTIVLSHPNSDHLNGLTYIAEHFKVKNLWSTGQAADTEGYRAFRSVIEKNKTSSLPFHLLPGKSEIGGTQVHILHPPKTFIPPGANDAGVDTNNHSLVIKIAMGAVSFLFPGDIEKEAETLLVNRHNNALSSTVLVAPHHGSRTSSTSDFLDAVSPETVIISSARAGRYRFPHAAVLKRYQRRKFQIFNTARNGAIQLATDGKRLNIRPTVKSGTKTL